MVEIDAGGAAAGEATEGMAVSGGSSGINLDIAKSMLNEARERVNLDAVKPSEEKHLVILGGQPAAGKSSIIKELDTKFKGNMVLLNGDEFKPLYPNYGELAKLDPDGTSKMVQPYSNYVVNNLKQEAIDKGLNTIIEGTMRTSSVPLETVEEFTKNGYTAEAYVVSSNYYSSRIGIEQRYEDEYAEKGYGRMVNPLNHDEAYRSIPNTLKDLVDSGKFKDITVVSRDAQPLASMSNGDDIVKSYVNSRDNLSPEIYKDVNNRIDTVNSMLSNRNAPAAAFENISSIKSALDNEYSKQNVKADTFTFGKGTKTSDVLDFYEKHIPDKVAQIRNENKIEYNGTNFKTENMRPQFMATILKEEAAKSNIDIKVEKSPELSKGFER